MSPTGDRHRAVYVIDWATWKDTLSILGIWLRKKAGGLAGERCLNDGVK